MVLTPVRCLEVGKTPGVSGVCGVRGWYAEDAREKRRRLYTIGAQFQGLPLMSNTRIRRLFLHGSSACLPYTPNFCSHPALH